MTLYCLMFQWCNTAVNQPVFIKSLFLLRPRLTKINDSNYYKRFNVFIFLFYLLQNVAVCWP